MNVLARHFAPDRRSAPRQRLKTPLRLRVWKSSIPEHTGESENVSAHGIFLATDLSLSVGTVVEVRLNMPEEITGEPTSEWCCTGHIVHSEPLHGSRGKQGMGVQFDCYQILRSSEGDVTRLSNSGPKKENPQQAQAYYRTQGHKLPKGA
jgi:hypothetical protein